MKTLLFILISFIAIMSIFTGLLMIGDPDGSLLKLPLSLLKKTPFKDFSVPGLLLTVIVGGVNLIAVFYNMQRRPGRYNWAMAGGMVAIVWTTIEIILIQTASWLHFLYLGSGVLIVLIAYQLKGKWAV